MSCACGVQCERPCNAEPGSVCDDCQCRGDDEHRAELLKLQDDLLQGANREVMAEALIERLKGELGEAQGFVQRVAKMASEVIQPTRLERDAMALVARWAAPPPAESTPVLCKTCGCTGGNGSWIVTDRKGNIETTERCPACRVHSPTCSLDTDHKGNCDHSIERQAHRIDDHERRLAALEAKGEPGTHADDICARPKCRSPRHYNIHDPERGGHDFVEPKGAKP